jgi:hypothetical protein
MTFCYRSCRYLTIFNGVSQTMHGQARLDRAPAGDGYVVADDRHAASWPGRARVSRGEWPTLSVAAAAEAQPKESWPGPGLCHPGQTRPGLAHPTEYEGDQEVWNTARIRADPAIPAQFPGLVLAPLGDLRHPLLGPVH